MTMQAIAAAMQRMSQALTRRPALALQDDAPAVAEWRGGTRAVTRHANGREVATDLGPELGGSGSEVSPGWLFRAGLAACAATRIAMSAACEGIELRTLRVSANSRSDTRGMLGLRERGGERIDAGPLAVTLCVRIAAPGVSAERLRALVEAAHDASPVACAAQRAVPVALRVDVEPG